MQCQRYQVTAARVSAIALAASDAWIVVAATAEGVWPERWFVAAAYVPDGDSGPTTQVVASEDVGLAPGARPWSMHISDDNVLAVALGTGGLRLYRMQAPLLPAIERGVALLRAIERGPFVAWAKWVAASASSNVALLSLTRASCCDKVQAHGAVSESDGLAQEVLTARYGEVLALDASSSGFAVVITTALVMHVLQLQHNQSFSVRTVSLASVRGHPSPLTFRAAAVGSRLVVVGYDTPSGDGMVEVFEADTGDMATWRSLPGRSPTALATDARRVVVGASRRSAPQSALYGFVSTRTACYTISSSGSLHGDWVPGTVVLHGNSCVFAHLVDEGGLVVEHWFPPAR